tara:strand:+ start:3788 stop:4600 length:813 start_codon:yes stop_codon:yes gene_type:complete
MKTVIYQYYDGETTSGNEAGRRAMDKYATKIGSEYIYEQDPYWREDLGRYSPHYGTFKPIYTDEFYEFDYLMYADTDVFPREGLDENIFEEFAATGADVGICEEWNAPEARKRYTIGGGINNANDEKWCATIKEVYGAEMPRTKSGLPKVYNSGMIIWSKEGMQKARDQFLKFASFQAVVKAAGLPDFYTCDQPYIHAMLEVCDFNWITMPYKWNSSVHYDPGQKSQPRPILDLRDEDYNFVHIQLNGADNWDADKLHRVTNLPTEEWFL